MPLAVCLCLGVSASSPRVSAAARVHEGGCARRVRRPREAAARLAPGCARDLLSAGLADGNLARELIACLSPAGRSPPPSPATSCSRSSPAPRVAAVRGCERFRVPVRVGPARNPGPAGGRGRPLPVTRATPAGHRRPAPGETWRRSSRARGAPGGPEAAEPERGGRRAVVQAEDAARSSPRKR